ncbi:LysR family transcriptional regulator [Nannocystis punicea]|uniref:LysR family transcriptional regulator n=1 Tax=Nannocystis punicea TaxID=2995304 RepID=A0ABY7H9P8_9BACT|nr:LysR family transcriptional regulator [Nannocystis poenicansa]WAS95709.1 LysR family transcriptional regulator [Nannocystis poenicansa]
MDALLANLPTLLVLARTHSLTAAAAELGVPRSTVSRRLARLEQELGVVLAERNTRSFTLTEAARRLSAEAGGLLARLQTVSETVRAEAGQIRGHLRFATPPGLAGSFIGRLLARFQGQHPAVEIEIVVTERRPHLLEERFDALVTSEAPPELPWTRRKLGHLWFVAVASPAYLALHPAPTRPQDLAEHVVLSGPRSPEGLMTWPRLRGASLPVRPWLVTNDLPTLRITALEGLGIALLPIHLVCEDLAANKLVQVLPEHIGATVDIVALFVPERGKSPVLRAFFDNLAKYTAELREVV